MRIGNNLVALNAHRQLRANNGIRQNAMERISSGQRVNRAGDDAAGLAISEKMRGQIRGLNQAARNAQDGISLIQTAEGALGEIHSILQRMRVLAVQANNDTNTAEDREKLQTEGEELLGAIDEIAGSVQFNTKPLLAGGTKIADRGVADYTVQNAFGLGVGEHTVTVERRESTLSYVTGGTTPLRWSNEWNVELLDPEMDGGSYRLSYDGVTKGFSVLRHEGGSWITLETVDVSDFGNSVGDSVTFETGIRFTVAHNGFGFYDTSGYMSFGVTGHHLRAALQEAGSEIAGPSRSISAGELTTLHANDGTGHVTVGLGIS